MIEMKGYIVKSLMRIMMMKVKTPTSTGNLADQAYKAVERLLVTLELEPGSIISERDLVDLTSMSRTPIRDAIQRFAWEGFFIIHPRSGIVIADIEPQNFSKVLDARMGVESILAKDAARFSGSHEHEKLREAIMQLIKSASDGDPYSFLDIDKMVDEIIGKAAGNLFAARAAAPLQTHSRRFWFRFRKGENAVELSVRHHINVIEAIIEGDPEKAIEKTRDLMRYLADMVKC